MGATQKGGLPPLSSLHPPPLPKYTEFARDPLQVGEQGGQLPPYPKPSYLGKFGQITGDNRSTHHHNAGKSLGKIPAKFALPRPNLGPPVRIWAPTLRLSSIKMPKANVLYCCSPVTLRLQCLASLDYRTTYRHIYQPTFIYIRDGM